MRLAGPFRVSDFERCVAREAGPRAASGAVRFGFAFPGGSGFIDARAVSGLGAARAMDSAPNQNTAASPDRFQILAAELSAAWRQLPDKALFFGLLAVWLALFQFLGSSTFGYIDTASLYRWMLNAYTSKASEDSHGLLIPVVVLVLFYFKRKELLAQPLAPWWPSLVIVAGALALHAVGYLVQQQRLSIIALFTGIYGLMGLVWGWRFLRASFFPFFLFGFCVPLGTQAEPVSFPLRLIVTKVVAFLSQAFLGIEVIRDGTQLKDPTGKYAYEVAAACSGLRSLIATIAIAVIYGFTTFKEWWKRGLMLASAFPLAVIGNVMRMMIIVLAAEWGGQATGAEAHESPLWSLVPYVPALFGLALLGRWLEDFPRRGAVEQAPPRA